MYWIATAVYLATIPGVAVLLHVRVRPHRSGPAAAVDRAGLEDTAKGLFVPTPRALRARIARQVEIRKALRGTVERHGLQLDEAATHYYDEMSERAGRANFSAVFNTRLVFLSLAPFLHVVLYFLAASAIVRRASLPGRLGPLLFAAPIILSTFAIAVLVLSRRNPKLVILGIFCGGAALAPLGVSVLANHHDLRWSPRVGPEMLFGGLALFTGATLILFICVVAVVAPSVGSISRAIWTRRATDLHAFADLQVVLHYLELGRDVFDDLRVRARMIRRLEWAAASMRSGMQRSFAIQNGASSATVRERLDGAARKLHEYQTWIALPGETTYCDLKRELSVLLVTMCSRRYGELPTAPVPAQSIPRRLRRIATGLLRVAVAVVPIAVIRLLEATGTRIEGPLGQILTLLSIFWFLVNALAAVDPLYVSHLSAVKDLMSLTKGGGSDR
jgi:hypothetical protein